MITHIKISNNGGVVSGTDGSDEVLEAIEPLLADLRFSIQDEMVIPMTNPINNMTYATLSNIDLVSDSLVLTSNGTALPAMTYVIDDDSGAIAFLAPPPMALITAEYDFTYTLEAEAIKQDNLQLNPGDLVSREIFATGLM